MLQRCGGSGGGGSGGDDSEGCGHVRFLPSHLCPRCWGTEVEWFAASGKGEVATFTIVHRAPSPEFAGRAPYVIALIDLEEGPRMMANILGDDALAVEIGDAVRVCFEERGDGAALPQFRRA